MPAMRKGVRVLPMIRLSAIPTVINAHATQVPSDSKRLRGAEFQSTMKVVGAAHVEHAFKWIPKATKVI